MQPNRSPSVPRPTVFVRPAPTPAPNAAIPAPAPIPNIAVPAPALAPNVVPANQLGHPLAVQEHGAVAPRPDAEARMKAHVAQLRRELNAVRKSVSVTAPDLVNYCVAHQHEDALVTGFKGRKNPWADEKRCNIL